MQVFNAHTQQDEDVVWSKAPNGELVATFDDGGFLKFPAGLSQKELTDLVEANKEANTGQEVVTEEMLAADEKTNALIDELNGNTMPESDKTNASPDADTA